MIKPLFLGLLLIGLPSAGVFAQTFSSGDLTGDLSLASPTPKPAEKKQAGADQAPQGPTTIDSSAMDYDEKTRVAIFTGADYGVFVKDPQFTVNCNKLTAYMRKGASAGASPSPGPAGKRPSTPAPQPRPGASGAANAVANSKASGLQRAIAEGSADQPVVIVQDKPASSGEEAQHNVGIAQKADYNADTGDIILTGWPRVSQGINTQIATSRDTVMIMNKDGRTMKTIGPSHSTIQEQSQPKKPGSNAASPAAASLSQ